MMGPQGELTRYGRAGTPAGAGAVLPKPSKEPMPIIAVTDSSVEPGAA